MRFSMGIFLAAALIAGGCASIPSDPSTAGEDRPHVVSTVPVGGEYNVFKFTQVEIRFSHLMDTGRTPGFEMYGGGISVEGRLRWIDPMTLVFRSDQPLKGGVTYQCFLKDGNSKAGEELTGVPYIWVFTVGD